MAFELWFCNFIEVFNVALGKPISRIIIFVHKLDTNLNVATWNFYFLQSKNPWKGWLSTLNVLEVGLIISSLIKAPRTVSSSRCILILVYTVFISQEVFGGGVVVVARAGVLWCSCGDQASRGGCSMCIYMLWCLPHVLAVVLVENCFAQEWVFCKTVVF